MSVILLSLYCLLQDIFHYLQLLGYNLILRPFMKYKEIIIIKDILKNKKPQMCLEYGAGYSTLYFSRYLEKNAKWIAIEHNKNWFKKIKQLIHQKGNVSIYYIPPNHSSLDTDPNSKDAFLGFEEYVLFPEKLNIKFDFILIDGEARKHCLEVAPKLLKKNGVIVLHDANRKDYHKSFGIYRFRVLFKDWRNDSGGLFVGSNTLEPYKVLNIHKHKLNWKILESFSKQDRMVITWFKKIKPNNQSYSTQ